MKVTCLVVLFLTVGSAALMQETSYAASPQHASDKNQPHSRAGLTAANRPKHPPTGERRPLPRNTASLRQPASVRSGGATKSGIVQNETTPRALPVRSAGLRSSVASRNPLLSQLPNNVRHRGPNPAILSGSANAASSNTGAINGTGMHRRH